MKTARALLGPDGPMARRLPGYEIRDGQLEMAQAVERALADGRVLFCEAGTGTGKTLAYLVPAILSGKKIVISTATRALQEQIIAHDLPLLRQALGIEPHAAVMKGLSNYLCLRRLEDFRLGQEAQRPSHASSLVQVERWRRETDSGDIAELAGIAEDDPIWREVTSSSDTRLGATCSHFDQCFVTRMKREAEAAQIVIVNHHLFFADLALRGPSHPARVLPDYEAVIFDEAHQLEEIATDFFGVRISSARIERMLRDAERAIGRANPLGQLGGGARSLGHVETVRATALELWRALASAVGASEPRVSLERDQWVGPLEQAWHALDSALEGLGAFAESSAGALAQSAYDLGEVLELTARRALQLRTDLATVIDGEPGRITWFDSSGRSRALSSSPVDLSEVFRQRVFESIPAVVLTSATLTNGSDFSYLRGRLGVVEGGVDVTELVVPSPFDFENNALLYTPRDLPPPGDAGFAAAATHRICELVELTDGGAFVLTTSLRSMHALHQALRARLPGRRLLVQGQAPKGALVSAFRAAEDAVLVATMSFWEGVDVPGRALRLVVLEKIPFLVPSDPLVRARSLAIEAAGERAFSSYHVPAAALTLKQGFGRLIRTRTDRGIVALLDERVLRRSYGRRLLGALPPARRTELFDEVRRFWRGAGA
jgi:ATP-dependent DNA helicase DinG